MIGERYRLLGRIGEGGMGAVYRAEHTLMKKMVALKLLHGELGQVDEAVRRFEREAQSASRLNHPNIIAVTDFGRAATGEFFLVMEYVPGQSLADALEQARRLPVGAGAGHRPPDAAGAGPRPRPGGGAPRSQAGQRHADPRQPDAAPARTW